MSTGQHCFTCPLWTGWFLLFGRVGTSSAALGRARSSETDVWKGEAVLHWCCNPAKPWGRDCQGYMISAGNILSSFLIQKGTVCWLRRLLVTLEMFWLYSVGILSNRRPLSWSSSICVTHLCLIKKHRATTEERALLSVSMKLNSGVVGDWFLQLNSFTTKTLNIFCVCASRFLRFGAHQHIRVPSHYSIFHQVWDSCHF